MLFIKYFLLFLKLLPLALIFQAMLAWGTISKRMLITNADTDLEKKYWLYIDDDKSSDPTHDLKLPNFKIATFDDDINNANTDIIYNLSQLVSDNNYSASINSSNLLDCEVNITGELNLNLGSPIFIRGIPATLMPQGSTVKCIKKISTITSGQDFIVSILTPQQQIFEAKMVSNITDIERGYKLTMLSGWLSSGAPYQLYESIDIDDQDNKKLMKIQQYKIEDIENEPTGSEHSIKLKNGKTIIFNIIILPNKSKIKEDYFKEFQSIKDIANHIYSNIDNNGSPNYCCGYYDAYRLTGLMQTISESASKNMIPKTIISIGSGGAFIEKCFDLIEGISVKCFDIEGHNENNFLPVEQAELPKDIGKCLPNDCSSCILLSVYPQGYLGPILHEFIRRGGEMLCTTVEERLFGDTHSDYEIDPNILYKDVLDLKNKKNGECFQIQVSTEKTDKRLDPRPSGGVQIQFYNWPSSFKQLILSSPSLEKICTMIKFKHTLSYSDEDDEDDEDDTLDPHTATPNWF